MKKLGKGERGFTLIELSIVLVIIGLIIGGVLVGQDLIRAAAVRAQVSQIEKYNTAVNTFRDKYGGLPGDINANAASQFGFVARGSFPGEGDGNGVIQGVFGDPANANGVMEIAGETAVFWEDLSQAHLIEGNFNTALSHTPSYSVPTGTPNFDVFEPQAKIGQGNYVYVWSGGTDESNQNSVNYFGLSALVSEQWGNPVLGNPGITPQQAVSIDKKIDDGLPQSGNVTAFAALSSFIGMWSAGGGVSGASTAAPFHQPTTAATPGTPSTCYDNGNVAGAVQQYSVEINNGANVNCAVSFRFQ